MTVHASAAASAAITRHSAMGRRLWRICRTIATRGRCAADPLAIRARHAAYISANAVGGRIVVRHGGTDCDGYSGESTAILPATLAHFEAFRQGCGNEAEGPWHCYIVERPDREAFESAYDGRLCGLSSADRDHFAGR